MFVIHIGFFSISNPKISSKLNAVNVTVDYYCHWATSYYPRLIPPRRRRQILLLFYYNLRVRCDWSSHTSNMDLKELDSLPKGLGERESLKLFSDCWLFRMFFCVVIPERHYISFQVNIKKHQEMRRAYKRGWRMGLERELAFCLC